jgi:ATP-dependent Clp protease ATP-binding subunit ClpC
MVFERYTQSARRVIFLAREDAMHYGSPYIESEHLLLGILRENEGLATRIGGETGSVNSFRKEIETKTTIGQSVTGSREVPLSADSKRILILAAAEADDLGQRQIGLAHFLLGILQVEKCLAARILQAHGATLAAMREETIRDMRWAGGFDLDDRLNGPSA